MDDMNNIQVDWPQLMREAKEKVSEGILWQLLVSHPYSSTFFQPSELHELKKFGRYSFPAASLMMTMSYFALGDN